MKQNRLTSNEENKELMVFRKEKLPIIETVDFKGYRLEASEKCTYLGVIIDRELTYQNQLNKVISKNGFSNQTIKFGSLSGTVKNKIKIF